MMKEGGLGTTKKDRRREKKEREGNGVLGLGHHWLASSTGRRKSFPIASRMDI